MDTVYVVGGNLNGINGTVSITGSDANNNWVAVADAGKTYWNINPLRSVTASITMPNSNAVPGGGTGASGDYLKRIQYRTSGITNSAVYLRDGTTSNCPDIYVGNATNAVTVAAAAVTPTLAGVAAFPTVGINGYVNRIIWMSYTPTGHGAVITIKRRIVSHGSFDGLTTGFVFVVTHPWPVGGIPTGWGIEHAASKEIIPFNVSADVGALEYGVTSVNGPWMVSVDSGVQVEVHGKFALGA